MRRDDEIKIGERYLVSLAVIAWLAFLTYLIW